MPRVKQINHPPYLTSVRTELQRIKAKWRTALIEKHIITDPDNLYRYVCKDFYGFHYEISLYHHFHPRHVPFSVALQILSAVYRQSGRGEWSEDYGELVRILVNWIGPMYLVKLSRAHRALDEFMRSRYEIALWPMSWGASVNAPEDFMEFIDHFYHNRLCREDLSCLWEILERPEMEKFSVKERPIRVFNEYKHMKGTR